MPRCEPEPRPEGEARGRPDWIGWSCLLWAAVFGVLYVDMLLRLRAPAVWATIHGAISH